MQCHQSLHHPATSRFSRRQLRDLAGGNFEIYFRHISPGSQAGIRNIIRADVGHLISSAKRYPHSNTPFQLSGRVVRIGIAQLQGGVRSRASTYASSKGVESFACLGFQSGWHVTVSRCLTRNVPREPSLRTCSGIARKSVLFAALGVAFMVRSRHARGRFAAVRRRCGPAFHSR